MSQDSHGYQRARTAAGIGWIVQFVMAKFMVALALMTGEQAMIAATWYAYGGLGIWTCLWLLYQQHKLEREEALEAERLAQQHGADSSIFEVSADDLSVARRRLRGMYKWLLPGVTVATALYLIVMGVLLAIGNAAVLEALGETPVDNEAVFDRAGVLMAVCAGIAFVGFLVCRYVAGMARQEAWKALRGGAGYLMGLVLINVALALTLGLVQWQEMQAPLRYTGPVVAVFMVILGVEFAMNLLLDLYRPRKAGEIPRPAFDSRLLSFLTSPESIARSLNEAINYQFGFEITRSWFWQMLQRWFVTLLLLGIVIMLAMTSFVVVEPNEQAVITRFGALRHSAQRPPLGPGLHVKWPWPIERAARFDVAAVRHIKIGSEAQLKAEDKKRSAQSKAPILWSQQHSVDEPKPLIVAPPRLLEAEDDEAPPAGASVKSPAISLVNAEVFVYYRIAEGRLLEYLRANADALEPVEKRDRRLRGLATRILARLLLRHDIDAWLGAARQTLARDLKAAVARVAEAEGLGVEILGVSVAGIHPPHKVADAFHEVIGAEQLKQAEIQKAHQEAIGTLANVAGSPDLARQLVQEIDRVERMVDLGAPKPEIAAQEQKIETLLRRAGGEAAKKIGEARGYRAVVVNAERGRAERFAKQRQAYRAAPDLYRVRHYLDVLAEGMQNARKYLLATERGRLEIRGDVKNVSGEGLDTLIEKIEEKEASGN